MARPLTKQKELLIKIFNENYHRKVNAPFGVLASPRNFNHDGVDYGANVGEPLYPIHDHIEVLKTVNNVNQTFTRTTYSEKDFGNYVIYYVPAWDVSVLYAHMNKVYVGTGKHGYVKLGESGNTGLSTGPHLHLGIAKGRHTALSTLRNEAINFETWSIPSEKPKQKEVDSQVVNDVILGKYGDEPVRSKKLKEAGYNPKEVQDAVNRSYGAKPQPKPKPQGFNPYNYLLPKGSKLYDSKGNAHAYPTTKEHTVKILQEKNGLGLIKEQWLVGVNEAWVKLGSKPKPKPKPQPKPSLVGKQVKLSGNTRLFHKATGSTTYPYNSVNKYTNLRTRHVPVVEETSDRVRVKIAGFDPELIWIDKKELR